MSDIERSDFLAAAGMADDSEAKFFSAAEIAGKLRAERDAAVKELAIIDERLSRRPALADCQTRADKIDRLCSRAGMYESVRAELDALRGRVRELEEEIRDAADRPMHAQPIGNCPMCQKPVYQTQGFCGNCHPGKL